MELKQKVAIGTVALLIAFAGGRWTSPVKIVETERKQTNTDRDKHRETTTTETVTPGGTKTTVTKTTEDTKTERKTDTVDTKTKETGSSSKVTVAALAGVRLNDLTKAPVYGLSIQRPLLGPLGAAVWGLSDTTLGVGISLSF